MKLAFLSTTRPQHSFRGALVDCAAQTIELKDAAVCNPAPNTVPTNVAWLGAFAYGVGAVNIILDNPNLDVVQLLLP